MERLTKRWGNNPAVPGTFYIDFVFEMDDTQAAAFRDFCNRLADYEDTNLTPDEIKIVFDAYARTFGKGVSFNRIQELIKADREGRVILIPAPAKEGDPKPECFHNDNMGLWCLGMAPSDGDEPTERCKQCWYCEFSYAAEEG